jgi:hypothetical protein
MATKTRMVRGGAALMCQRCASILVMPYPKPGIDRWGGIGVMSWV